MKLNRILSIAAAGAFLVSVTSCADDFLDEKMYSSYGANVSDTNAKVLGLYYKVGGILGYSDQQGYAGIWQDGTDVGAPGDIQGVETPFYQYANLNSENAGVKFLWNSLYSIINAANIIINEEGVAEKYRAEACFFRAWAYEQLVTGWGRVPLLTESIATPSTDFTRTDISAINAVIESDIEYAIANLPEITEYDNSKDKAIKSRLNKDAARLWAAQVYLRIGYQNNSNDYYNKAVNAVTPTITSGNYTLINKRYGSFLGDAGDFYSDMFRYGNQRRYQNNTENIWVFEMEYGVNVPNGTIGAPQQRRNWVAAFHKLSGQMVNADSIGGRGNGRLRLSNYVKYGIFEDGDIRNSNFNIRRKLFCNDAKLQDKPITVYVDAKGFKVSEGTAGATARTLHYGDPAVWAESDTLNVMYPHTTKWGGYDPTDDFGWALVKDFPMMRFAEAYLLRAEAYVRLGNTSAAAADINALRDRAFKESREYTGNNSLGAVSASQMTIDFILDERIRELVGEENRRFTLMRTGELTNRVNMMVTKWAEGTDSKKISGYNPNVHTLLPIPLTEIQLNKDADLEQNPGYEVAKE